MIQNADSIILPQSCSLPLYRTCTHSEAHVFPNYELRFRYPGKVGQSLLFEKLKISHPATKRWPSVKKFRYRYKEESAPSQDKPFFLKADKSHEGDGVLFVTDRKSLETALARLEKVGSEGFISQELIPCRGNVLRTVVLHKDIISYWKRSDNSHGGHRYSEPWITGGQERGSLTSKRREGHRLDGSVKRQESIWLPLILFSIWTIRILNLIFWKLITILEDEV